MQDSDFSGGLFPDGIQVFKFRFWIAFVVDAIDDFDYGPSGGRAYFEVLLLLALKHSS